jgi:hypothetical protein
VKIEFAAAEEQIEDLKSKDYKIAAAAGQKFLLGSMRKAVGMLVREQYPTAGWWADLKIFSWEPTGDRGKELQSRFYAGHGYVEYGVSRGHVWLRNAEKYREQQSYIYDATSCDKYYFENVMVEEERDKWGYIQEVKSNIIKNIYEDISVSKESRLEAVFNQVFTALHHKKIAPKVRMPFNALHNPLALTDKTPIRVLQVAYGPDTYVCEYLEKILNCEVDLVNVDLFSKEKPMYETSKYELLNIDALTIAEKLKDQKFDIILGANAGLDLFMADDYLDLLNDLYTLLEDDGILIFPIKGMQFANNKYYLKGLFQNRVYPGKETARKRRGWSDGDPYNTPIYKPYKADFERSHFTMFIDDIITNLFDAYCKQSGLDYLFRPCDEHEKEMSSYEIAGHISDRPIVSPLAETNFGSNARISTVTVSLTENTAEDLFSFREYYTIVAEK